MARREVSGSPFGLQPIGQSSDMPLIVGQGLGQRGLGFFGEFSAETLPLRVYSALFRFCAHLFPKQRVQIRLQIRIPILVQICAQIFVQIFVQIFIFDVFMIKHTFQMLLFVFRLFCSVP